MIHDCTEKNTQTLLRNTIKDNFNEYQELYVLNITNLIEN